MSLFEILGKDAAIEKIVTYVYSVDPAPVWNDWYVGITGDVSKTLYGEHKAPFDKSVFVSVDSAATAKSVKEFLLSRFGMDGRPDAGEYPWRVYAFRKTLDTDPPR